MIDASIIFPQYLFVFADEGAPEFIGTLAIDDRRDRRLTDMPVPGVGFCDDLRSWRRFRRPRGLVEQAFVGLAEHVADFWVEFVWFQGAPPISYFRIGSESGVLGERFLWSVSAFCFRTFRRR